MSGGGARFERAAGRGRAAVVVTSRPLWRIRFGRELPRRLVYATAAVGLAASARLAVDPPRTTVPAALLRRAPAQDLAAQGYATLFARAYLTWEASGPEARERALAPFLDPGMDAGAGLQPPPGGEQRVEWVDVVQEREPQPAEHVYTVAAQTDAAGLLYLTVTVLHPAGGVLSTAGYPAFVGPPASGPPSGSGSGLASGSAAGAAGGGSVGASREVSDPELSTVVERALRNYLADSPSELAADLAPGARVSPPGFALALRSVQSLDWAPGAGAVIAVVQAQDARGARYTLAYELDVVREQGRIEIAAIQMDPDR
jgi:Conjugative transposon protein TcpC